MKFNIAKLDKVKLIQTLYDHAFPKGYGEIEHERLLDAEEPIKHLTVGECNTILRQSVSIKAGYLIDYIYGKPLKIKWKEISSDMVVMSSVPYDLYHGRYRFLKALLTVFAPEDIRILNKDYDPLCEIDFAAFKPGKEEKEFKYILDKAVVMTDEMNHFYFGLDPLVIANLSSFSDIIPWSGCKQFKLINK